MHNQRIGKFKVSFYFISHTRAHNSVTLNNVFQRKEIETREGERHKLIKFPENVRIEKGK